MKLIKMILALCSCLLAIALMFTFLYLADQSVSADKTPIAVVRVMGIVFSGFLFLNGLLLFILKGGNTARISGYVILACFLLLAMICFNDKLHIALIAQSVAAMLLAAVQVSILKRERRK